MSSCRKCLTGRSGDKIGDKCRTQGCDGIIEESQTMKDVADELPEPMTCGRRVAMGLGANMADRFTKAGDNLDRWWKFKANGQRTCSFCGSLHPDDFFALVKASAEAPEDATYRTVIGIEPSDKPYKIYVHQPGVRNADEGGIKMYTHHLPWTPEGISAVTPEQNELYKKAVANSNARFRRMLVEGRQRKEG